MKDYKIVIFISRHSISFAYTLKGGGGALQLQPMDRQQWPQPLAFFCEPTGNIIIGRGALNAVRTKVQNSFSNYFDLLKENLYYTICGQEKQLNYLLLDASELLFRDFYSSVLYNRYGPLDNNRRSMPLTIVCESDLDNDQRAYIYNLFVDGGYANVVVTQYDQFVHEHVNAGLAQMYGCNHVLSVLCDGDDMTLTLIDAKNGAPRSQKRFPKFGIDPRVEYVSDQLWEDLRYVGWLTKEKEWQVIQETVKDFLNSGEYQVCSRIKLSDGDVYDYTLTRSNYNVSFEQDSRIWNAIDNFLGENGLKSKSGILLLLRGNAAANDHFRNILQCGFDKDKIKYGDKKFVDEINKRIIAFEGLPQAELENLTSVTSGVHLLDESGATIPIAKSGLVDSVTPVIPEETCETPSDEHPSKEEIKSLNRGWRECKAAVNGMVNNKRYKEARTTLQQFLVKCQEAKYVALIDEVKKHIESTKEEETPPSPHLTDLRKEWREVKAGALAKKRAERFAEALQELETFMRKCKSVGVNELESDVNAIIAQIPRKNTSDIIDPRLIRQRSNNENMEERQPKPDNRLEGLIRDRKFAEARDLCNAQGDEEKARTLQKIIRSQRSIDMRKNALDECRKLKNMTQIERIVKEIEEHIALCESINVPCGEEKKLRKDYKSIK